MKDATTTDWNLLLSNKCGVKTLSKFAIGNVSTQGVSTCFANTDKASEFRKLVRTHGSTYKMEKMEAQYITWVQL